MAGGLVRWCVCGGGGGAGGGVRVGGGGGGGGHVEENVYHTHTPYYHSLSSSTDISLAAVITDLPCPNIQVRAFCRPILHN